MTIQQIYDLAIQMGIEADPRGEDAVKKQLARAKKDYSELSEKKKKYFDKESLTNPYSDTRIFAGDPKISVKKALVGIDSDASEILLADRLNQKGEGIDLVIGHHPVGIALAGLHDVMDLQVDAGAAIGAPINVLHALMSERQEDIKRRIHPSNHNQVVDTARLLNIPLMNLHTVWDNLGDKFMKEYLAEYENDLQLQRYCFLFCPFLPEIQVVLRLQFGSQFALAVFGLRRHWRSQCLEPVNCYRHHFVRQVLKVNPWTEDCNLCLLRRINPQLLECKRLLDQFYLS